MSELISEVKGEGGVSGKLSAADLDLFLGRYLDILMKYNVKVNLVSRKMTFEGLQQLVNETLLLEKYLSKDTRAIVDAGSGNGSGGVPISLMVLERRVFLIEPKKKKVEFLRLVKNEMNLVNVEVVSMSIEEFVKKKKDVSVSLVARGFPEIGVFGSYVRKGYIEEAVVVTSENKIEKNKIQLESLDMEIYNVPMRDSLKILKLRGLGRK